MLLKSCYKHFLLANNKKFFLCSKGLTKSFYLTKTPPFKVGEKGKHIFYWALSILRMFLARGVSQAAMSTHVSIKGLKATGC